MEAAAGDLSNSDAYDDDGRVKRTGTLWTTSAHIVTAVIGSGVLTLAWAIAQLGWIAGPAAMLLFAAVIFYTSSLLADCYRHPITGKRNYTYMDAVQANLGGSWKVKLCGWFQYIYLFGSAVGYTIAASLSMRTIEKSRCLRKHGGCNNGSATSSSTSTYMIIFAMVEIVFSQIPNFDQIWWLSILASAMSFTYSSAALALGVLKLVSNINGGAGGFKGTFSGAGTGSHKAWHSLQALGDIAFAYDFAVVIIEIEDTIRSSFAAAASESKVMKRATIVSVTIATVYYMLCGCFGYAAFGDAAPGNLLAAGSFEDVFWLVGIANAAVAVQLAGSYQVYCQPLFAFVENWARRRWPESKFISPATRSRVNVFRVMWRTAFVVVITVISMLLPFFNVVVGLIGAVTFWPLTVFLPVEMYIAREKVPRFGRRWVLLKMLSGFCLVVSVAATVGSVAGMVGDLHKKS